MEPSPQPPESPAKVAAKETAGSGSLTKFKGLAKRLFALDRTEFQKAFEQDEKDRRVFAQAIHLIKQLVEQTFLATTTHLLPRAGNEINILDHNHHGLEEPRKLDILIEQSHLLGGNEQCRVVRQLAGEGTPVGAESICSPFKAQWQGRCPC